MDRNGCYLTVTYLMHSVEAMWSAVKLFSTSLETLTCLSCTTVRSKYGRLSDETPDVYQQDVSVGVWLAPLKLNRKHDLRFDTEWKVQYGTRDDSALIPS